MAESIDGMNMAEFNQCYSSRDPYNAVEAEITEARAAGVVQTPQVFINGEQVDPTFEAIQARVNELLGN